MLKRVAIAMIRFYQRYLSPLKRAPSCRFMPTCSSYALEAIQRRGLLIGIAKASWRLLRCNPLFPGGFDPVDKPRESRHAHLEGHEGLDSPDFLDSLESMTAPERTAAAAAGFEHGSHDRGSGSWSAAQTCE